MHAHVNTSEYEISLEVLSEGESIIARAIDKKG